MLKGGMFDDSAVPALHDNNVPTSHDNDKKDAPESAGLTSPPEIPGKPTSVGQKLLNVGTSVLENFSPVNKICQHVCAFHFYANDMTRQVEAHHYCGCPSDEFRQCVIYDSDKPDARLIGIEYIISRRLFQGLPQEEKKLWHSHKFEVMSGMLYAPGVPNAAEHLEMQKLVDTYGKTWHTWQVDRGDALPLGVPQLMMAFTAEGQVKPELLASRDARYGKRTSELEMARASVIKPPLNVEPDADAWEPFGKVWQTYLKQVDLLK